MPPDLAKLATPLQPSDMEIIAALKKYSYLNDILDFYELGLKLKAHKREQANRLPQGAVGIAWGNPVHLLDAAQYIKLAWDSFSDATIKNAFNFTSLSK